MTEPGAPTKPAANARCRVIVAGPLSAGAIRALQAQYGQALTIDRVDRETVLDLDGLDHRDRNGVRGVAREGA